MKDLLAEIVIRLECFANFHNMEYDKDGRGICIFIRSDLKAVKHDQLCLMHFKESVWLDLRLKEP